MRNLQPDRPRQRAFTLIEVLVALAIAAVALASVAAALSQMVDSSTSLQERTYATWIAENEIAALRLASERPDVGELTGDESYAGREWHWRAVVSETGVENLFRVDVAVSFADSERSIRTVTGFIGEPGIPGLGNNAWNGILVESSAGSTR